MPPKKDVSKGKGSSTKTVEDKVGVCPHVYCDVRADQIFTDLWDEECEPYPSLPTSNGRSMQKICRNLGLREENSMYDSCHHPAKHSSRKKAPKPKKK